MASDIPKFTSFRPKLKVPPDIPSGTNKTDSSQEKHDAHHHTRRRSRHGESRTRNKSDKRETLAPTRKALNDLQARQQDSSKHEESVLFFSDRKGDVANLTYGSLNRHQTPAYRRYGHGSILGLPSNAKIDREQSTEKGIYLKGPSPSRQKRLFTSKHAVSDSQRSVRFMKADNLPHQADMEYVSLSSTKTRERDSGSDLEEGLDKLLRHDPDERDDPDLVDDIESHDLGSDIKQKNAALIRKTRTDSQNVQAWLELIGHQTVMFNLDRSITELRSHDKLHLAEIKLSIYEQAIRKIITTHKNLITLHVGMMEEASQLWSYTKLTNQWEVILAKFPSHLEVWIPYLNFVQSNFSTFKYEDACKAFRRCLKALSSQEGSNSTEDYLHILLRFTAMIRDAGYHELSFAIWQALLEYHLMRPHGLEGQDVDGRLQRFEEFWESEVPRLGDQNAKGWRNFHVGDDSARMADIQSNLYDAILPTVHNFGKLESEQTRQFRCPGRTTDHGREDDPFHLVFFQDIAEFLLGVSSQIPELALLDAFFCFSGLPSVVNEESSQSAYRSDPFVVSLKVGHRIQTDESGAFDRAFTRFMEGPSRLHLTTESLFDNGFTASDDKSSLVSVRRALKLLVKRSTYPEAIAEYLLAFEFNHYPSDVSKTARQLLKARPTSARIYNAYGLVESRMGNTEKASHVFGTALSMAAGTDSSVTFDSLTLLHSWVWEALRNDDRKTAVRRLVSLSGGTSAVEDRDGVLDQAALLRGRTQLQNTDQRALLAGDYPSAILSTSLLALLAYLSGDQDIKSAMTVFTTLSCWLDERGMSQSSGAELLAQSIARVLTYHTAHAAIVKPSLLRTILEPLLDRFSDNTLLLSLYAANEARFSINDRVRGIMRNKSLNDDSKRSINAWAFAIHHEMNKGDLAGSTGHSVRALFEKAEQGNGAHCPTLWKQHVLFELEEARKERAKWRIFTEEHVKTSQTEKTKAEASYRRIKEAFFRGLTHLPWCKDYAMLAFTHLEDDVLTSEELRKVYNVMIEKEIRVYVDLDDDSV